VHNSSKNKPLALHVIIIIIIIIYFLITSRMEVEAVVVVVIGMVVCRNSSEGALVALALLSALCKHWSARLRAVVHPARAVSNNKNIAIHCLSTKRESVGKAVITNRCITQQRLVRRTYSIKNIDYIL